MKYFTIEETTGQGTRIYIKESGKYLESMPIEIYTNPEGYRARHGVERFNERISQLKGLIRVDNERAFAWENGFIDML